MWKSLLLSGVLLGTTLACTTTTTNAENNNTPENSPVEVSSVASSAEYRKIEIEEFKSRYNFSNINPRTVGLELFSNYIQESEGRQSESLSIEYPNPGEAVTTITIIGLADDSVRAIRYRINFAVNENSWDIVSVGSQTQCRQNRGHQDWSAELCL
jgi:hypothetical protein